MATGTERYIMKAFAHRTPPRFSNVFFVTFIVLLLTFDWYNVSWFYGSYCCAEEEALKNVIVIGNNTTSLRISSSSSQDHHNILIEKSGMKTFGPVEGRNITSVFKHKSVTAENTKPWQWMAATIAEITTGVAAVNKQIDDEPSIVNKNKHRGSNNLLVKCNDTTKPLSHADLQYVEIVTNKNANVLDVIKESMKEWSALRSRGDTVGLTSSLLYLLQYYYFQSSSLSQIPDQTTDFITNGPMNFANNNKNKSNTMGTHHSPISRIVSKNNGKKDNFNMKFSSSAAEDDRLHYSTCTSQTGKQTKNLTTAILFAAGKLNQCRNKKRGLSTTPTRERQQFHASSANITDVLVLHQQALPWGHCNVLSWQSSSRISGGEYEKRTMSVIVLLENIRQINSQRELLSATYAKKEKTLPTRIQENKEGGGEDESNRRSPSLLLPLPHDHDLFFSRQYNGVTINNEHQLVNKNEITENQSTTKGVIVLGMHRSGTSLMTMLLNYFGLNTGSNLYGAAPDNPKGFFERKDVVKVNNALLTSQNGSYSANNFQFNSSKALTDLICNLQTKRNELVNTELKRALMFCNDPKRMPWVIKDPRLCITLPAWLPFIDTKPAVVIIFRDPFDVALSLSRRYEHFPIDYSLKLWYVYNKKAILNSAGLCRVMFASSNLYAEATAKVAVEELLKKLKTQCNFMSLNKENKPIQKISELIDRSLLHHKIGSKETADTKKLQITSSVNSLIKFATNETPASLNTSSNSTESSCSHEKKLAFASKSSIAKEKCRLAEAVNARMDLLNELGHKIDAQQANLLYFEVLRTYFAMQDGTVLQAEYRWDDSIIDDGIISH